MGITEVVPLPHDEVEASYAKLRDSLKENKLGIDIRIIGADWKGKKYTGYDLPIGVYFNTRDHSFSTSSLRKRVCEQGCAKNATVNEFL